MTDRVEFKRVVLGLHLGRADPSSLRLAAELADLLDIDLSGLFIIDEGLLATAELPFARELRRLGGGWHPLRTDQLGQHLEGAARQARQLLAQAAKTWRITTSFEIARGSTARVLATVPQLGDILIITEPGTPAERLSEPFASLLDRALQSAAYVMLIPARLERTRGPVIAIAMTPTDASVAIAAAIAAAAKETLIVVETYGREAGEAVGAAVFAAAGLAVTRMTVPGAAAPDRDKIATLLGRLNERFVVMSRDAAREKFPPSLIVAERRVPVLIDRPR